MKKTMTKEEFGKLWVMNKGWLDFYDALSEAGISFDIYSDSDGQIIKPGDEVILCTNNDCVKIFLGIYKGFYFCAQDVPHTGGKAFTTSSSDICRKLPAEVWEPVPADDLAFNDPNDSWARFVCQVNTNIWAKTRVTNGKLEGVRK